MIELEGRLGDVLFRIKVGVLTARRVVNAVICCGVHDKPAEADGYRDKPEGKNTRESDLLTTA